MKKREVMIHINNAVAVTLKKRAVQEKQKFQELLSHLSTVCDYQYLYFTWRSAGGS